MPLKLTRGTLFISIAVIARSSNGASQLPRSHANIQWILLLSCCAVVVLWWNEVTFDYVSTWIGGVSTTIK